MFTGYNSLETSEWDLPICSERSPTFITSAGESSNNLVAMRKLRRAMRMDKKRQAQNQEFKRFETIKEGATKKGTTPTLAIERIDSLSSSENLD